MGRLAIIPARGGSKRIPRKNIKDFLGKPIIAYSIEAALDSNLFDEVMVSTDDEEIVDIAKSFNASVPFMRSSKNSNDYATTVDVIIEVIDQYRAAGKSFDEICCIYATAPFVTENLLLEAHNIFDQGFDTVFPVLPFSFPIQRALRIENDKVVMFQKEHMSTRSQDLEKAYHDSGQFYWMRPQKVISEKTLFTDNTSSIILSEMDAHDIDTVEDWRMAEFKYSFIHGKS